MIKNIVLVAVLVLAAGAWFYLDYTNKQDQMETVNIRIKMEQTRAAGVMHARAQLEEKLRMALIDCQNAAQKAKVDFLTQNRKPVRGKPNEVSLALDVMDKAETTFVAANAACMNDYADHLAKGS